MSGASTTSAESIEAKALDAPLGFTSRSMRVVTPMTLTTA